MQRVGNVTIPRPPLPEPAAVFIEALGSFLACNLCGWRKRVGSLVAEFFPGFASTEVPA